MKLTSRVFVLVVGAGILSWAVSAQQTAGSPSETAARVSALAPGESILNLDKLKDEVKQYYECTCKCGCYNKDLDLQADRAIAFLKRRMAHADTKDKMALVLDIDETTLSNYEEMVGAGFAYDSKTFNAWVESGKAPAIPATLRIYKSAQKLGVHVFFLTGRPESQRTVTEANLRAVGFDGWQKLILRQQSEGSMSAQVYKSEEREKIAAEGYRIILNVGDQWSDLRGKTVAEYSVKYPDPYYFLK